MTMQSSDIAAWSPGLRDLLFLWDAESELICKICNIDSAGVGLTMFSKSWYPASCTSAGLESAAKSSPIWTASTAFGLCFTCVNGKVIRDSLNKSHNREYAMHHTLPVEVVLFLEEWHTWGKTHDIRFTRKAPGLLEMHCTKLWSNLPFVHHSSRSGKLICNPTMSESLRTAFSSWNKVHWT